MTPDVVEKKFSAAEFAVLLDSAARRLLEQCGRDYCHPSPPSTFRFVLESSLDSEPRPPARLLDALEATAYLVRSDGSFRDWIDMSPVGVWRDVTVLELCYPERFITRLLTGKLAFPFEPLHLLGPALPPSWQEGEPVPKVALPELPFIAFVDV